jgi:diguanylate cyclase
LLTNIGQLLKTHDVNPAHIILEITESAIMSRTEKALQVLTNLAAMGFKLSVDDFGTGYATLAYLKNLTVHELKIDHSFVTNMCNDENDTLIVHSTIELAHSLGLQVVAEGIESQEILEMLTHFGSDFGQGYFIAHPLPLDQFNLWFNESSWNHNRTKMVTIND